jgi:hypothetical protein
MLSIISSLANSNLRPFVSTSYSLELYFRLSEAKNGRGVEELYDSLCSPKPKQQAFARFIKLLADKGLIEITIGSDKRTKNINLKTNSTV